MNSTVNGLAKIVAFSIAARCSVVIVRNTASWTQCFRGTTKRLSTAGEDTRKLSTSVADLRKEYSRKGLNENDVKVIAGPFHLFSSWLQDACDAKVVEPNAMCLSTCLNNKPSSRFVLLKALDTEGFVWFTNYQSRKGEELSANPNACLTFWWGDLERSVRIEGIVEKVSEEESMIYFQSRPRGSQLGAWSSNQSRSIQDRTTLDNQGKQAEMAYGHLEVIPKPPHWGGFRLKPLRMEFWKGRESRLHDRLVFERSDTSSQTWDLSRLQP
jgi:pyridoxamine 5'-phosphate oxidase